MSISFEDPMNEETGSLIRKMFGDKVVDMDERNVLVNEMQFTREKMSKIANTAKQPVSLEIYGPGDRKTMSDGTEYRCTLNGWRKVEPGG